MILYSKLRIYDHLILRLKRDMELGQIAAENDRFTAGFYISENHGRTSPFRASG